MLAMNTVAELADHLGPDEELTVDGDRQEVQLWHIHEDETRSLAMVLPL